jgi:hypothetical protein
MGNSSSISEEEMKEKYSQLIMDGEKFEAGFKLVRDAFLFTDKRMILIDVQGMTGSKVEVQSIPYKSISKFSVETNGKFDLDAELKIWIGSDPRPIEKKFNRSVNVFDVQNLLANYIAS